MGDLNNSLKCDSLFRWLFGLNKIITDIYSLYRFYNDALNAACGEGLFGLFIMLVSAIISALFFTILVWCNSHTWIYFKHKAKYVKVGINIERSQTFIIACITGWGPGPLHAPVHHWQGRQGRLYGDGINGLHGRPHLPAVSHYPHPAPDAALSRHSQWSRHHGGTRGHGHAAWTETKRDDDGQQASDRPPSASRGHRVSFG